MFAVYIVLLVSGDIGSLVEITLRRRFRGLSLSHILFRAPTSIRYNSRHIFQVSAEGLGIIDCSARLLTAYSHSIRCFFA